MHTVISIIKEDHRYKTQLIRLLDREMSTFTGVNASAAQEERLLIVLKHMKSNNLGECKAIIQCLLDKLKSKLFQVKERKKLIELQQDYHSLGSISGFLERQICQHLRYKQSLSTLIRSASEFRQLQLHCIAREQHWLVPILIEYLNDNEWLFPTLLAKRASENKYRLAQSLI